MEMGSDSFVDKAAGQWPRHHAMRYGQLALRCIEIRRNRRPDIEEVFSELDALLAECPKTSKNKDVQSSPLPCPDPTGQHENVCVVCMDEPSTHIFYPCGHQCVCKSDADILMSSTKVCPLCRKPALGVVQVYS
mmetsp:Transcript_3326/g.6213  ORF Transcript_3326/g.6213 Transcript_3326/m.6213 type:complete len:134 (+) Transcript_3326:2238-2639(+)